MTYYRILQYLKANGLDDGKAHYVRNMIRELRLDASLRLGAMNDSKKIK